MLTIPVALYLIFRYLWQVQSGQGGEEPAEVVLGDHPFQLALALWLALALVSIYLL